MTRLRLLGLAGLATIIILIVASIFLYANVMQAFRFTEPPLTRPTPAPVQFLQAKLAAEEEVLASAGWLDTEAGTLHVPITEAMDLMMGRGASAIFRTQEVAEAPPAETTQERLSLSVEGDNLPQDTNAVTVRFIGADGELTTTTLRMPAAIERVDVSASVTDRPTAAEPAAEPATETATETAVAPEEAAAVDTTEADAAPAATTRAAADFDWQALGAGGYTNHCSSCHQAEGQGIPGAFPPLAGHTPDLYAADRNYLIYVLLYGLQGEIEVEGQTYNGVMPAWQQLSDEEIAAILNYTLTSWGNEALLPGPFEAYTPDDIAGERGNTLSPADVHQLRQTLTID